MKKIIFLTFLTTLLSVKAFSQTVCATGDCSNGGAFSMTYCITTPTCGGFTGDISATMTTTMPNCVGCVEVLLTGTDNPNTRTANVNITAGGASASFAGIPEGFYVLTTKTPIVPTPPLGSTTTSYVCSKLIQINAVDTLVINGTANNDPCPVIAPFQGSITGVSVTGGTAPYTFDWADVPGTNNSANRSGLAPGTYTVTVTDAKGCTKNRTFSIIEQKPVVTLTATPNPVCPPSAPFNINISWTATPGGGFLPGQYYWDGSAIPVDNGQASSTISQIVTTYNVFTHSVIFQDINNCFSDPVSVSVPVDSKPTGTISPITASVCPGLTVTLTGTTTSCSSIGATPCVYSFDNGATYQPSPDNDAVFTVNAPMVVNMRIRNATGCVSDPIVANLDTLGKPKITYTVNPNPVCPNNSSNITINFTCTPVNCAGYQYNFNNTGLVPATPVVNFTSPVVAATTSFPLNVVGPNGCPLDTAIVLNVFPNPTSISAPDTIVCANNVGAFGPVTLTAVGFSSITSWSPGGQTTTSITVVPSVNTTYTVTGIDINGCPRTATKQVVSLAQPNVTTPTPVDHCQGTTSLLTASGALTYTWHDAAFALQFSGNPFSVTPIANTSYNVIGTDANGCKDTANVVVNFRPRPTGSALATPSTICAGNNSSIAITVDPPFVAGNPGFSYNNGGSYVATNPLAVGPFATTTTINTKIKDQYGCISNSIPVTVTVLPFTAAVTGATAACSYSTNGTATLTVTGGNPTYDYSVDIAGGPFTAFSTAGTTQALTGLAAGPHTIYVRDAGNNCNTTANFTVVTPAPLVLDTTAVNDVRCKGETNGSIVVNVSGGTSTYDLYLNTIGAATFTNVVAGSYTYGTLAGGVSGALTYDLIVEDNNGCRDTVQNVPVNEPSNALVAPAVTPQLFCTGTTGVFTMTPAATGGWGSYTYNFNGSAVALNGTVSGLAAGSYPLVVTDLNGCTASTTVTFSTRPLPTGSAIATPSTVCAGNTSSIAITVNAPFVAGNPGYSYNNGATYVITNPLVVGPLTADTTVNTRIQDQFGCISANIPVTVTVLPFSAAVTGASALCSYSTNGGATVTVTGGTPTFQYSVDAVGGPYTSFSTAGTSEVLAGLSAGAHTVFVRDAGNTCNTSTNFTVTTPAPLVLSLTSLTDVRCKGETNGSIVVNVSGGTSTYDLYLNTISGSPALSNVAAGSQTYTGLAGGVAGSLTYDLIVEDNNGCRDTVVDIVINEPATPLVAPAITPPSFCFGTSTGVFTLTPAATGGWGTYTYTFNGTSILLGGTQSGLTAGTYPLVVTDLNGCTDNVSVVLNSSPELFANVNVTPSDCGSNGAIDFLPSTGGTPSYDYSLDGVTFGASVPTDLNPVTVNTTATLYVRDAQGCTDDTTVTVLNIPRGIPIISIVPPACPGGSDGSIVIDSVHIKIPGGEPFSYNLFKDQTPPVSVGVGGPSNANVSVSFVSLSGGNHILQMSDQACANYAVDSFRVYTSPTAYTVVTTASVLNPGYAAINVPQPLPFATSSIALASDINQSTGTVILYNLTGGTTLVGTGGKPAYQMSIDNPTAFVNRTLGDTLGNQTYVTFSGLAPGPHTVFIRDANGCSDTILIQVPGKFYIPNLVTPNQDTRNDVFEIVSLPDNSGLRLYNRWGDRVFESSNYDNKYDFKGLSDGVYYYDLEFNTGTHFKGWVQVLR